MRNWWAFLVVEVGFNRTFRNRTCIRDYGTAIQWAVITRHWLTLDLTLYDTTTAIRLGDETIAISLDQTRLANNPLCLHIARLGNRKRLGIDRLALHLGRERGRGSVHRLGHANRPTLQKRNSSDCCREFS